LEDEPGKSLSNSHFPRRQGAVTGSCDLRVEVSVQDVVPPRTEGTY
jgi:hypothetical protein